MLLPLRDYNPTRRLAWVTIIIIAANLAIFAYQAYFSPQPLAYHILKSAMVPREIVHMRNVAIPLDESHHFPRDIPPPLSLLTSLFMHGSLLHLLGNMLFLWIFGNNIEDHLGRWRYGLFYLATGVGASLIHVLFHPSSLIPVIGASGAVSGVMGAYLILFPRARIKTLLFLFIIVTTVDLPAAVFLIVWFVYQFLLAGNASGIAWLAHVGGFTLGMILVRRKRPRLTEAATLAVSQGETDEPYSANVH